MESGEPTEDAPTRVIVKVNYRSGQVRRFIIPDRTKEDLHAEIADGFLQQSYLLFELPHSTLYVNYAEVLSVEMQDNVWIEHE
jgi:hypothetical protein